MQAGFARFNLNYNDTYFLTIIGRYDGSSRFGKNNSMDFSLLSVVVLI
jgi:hypothetical protein